MWCGGLPFFFPASIFISFCFCCWKKCTLFLKDDKHNIIWSCWSGSGNMTMIIIFFIICTYIHNIHTYLQLTSEHLFNLKKICGIVVSIAASADTPEEDENDDMSTNYVCKMLCAFKNKKCFNCFRTEIFRFLNVWNVSLTDTARGSHFPSLHDVSQFTSSKKKSKKSILLTSLCFILHNILLLLLLLL